MIAESASYNVPHSKEAEARVIGSAMVDPAVLRQPDVESLRPDHFYSRANEAVWQAVLDLDTDGELPSIDQVVERLRVSKGWKGEGNLLADVGGPVYIIGLAEAGVPFDAASDARHVLDHAIRRRVVKVAGTAMNEALAATTPVDEVVGKLDSDITELVRDPTTSTSPYEAYEAAMAALEGKSKIRTGFHALDARFGGWPVGDLATVAARSTTGKSSFIYQVAIELINRLDGPVGILSPDQELGEIFKVLAARLSRVSSERIELGEASVNERKAYAEAVTYVRTAISPKLIIRDSFLGHRQVEREYNKLIRKGCKAIILDTLQAVDEGSDFKKTQIDNTCRVLKGLARQYRNVTITVSQIKQDVAYRPDKVPRDYDMSDSKNIYDLSNTVLFLHRPWIDDNYQNENEVQVRIAKQKTGRKNAYAELFFRPDLQMFVNYDGSIPGLEIKGQPFG